MPWFLYNVLFTVGYVLMLPRFIVRMWRRGGYRQGFGQRFGFYAPGVREALHQRERVWVHAVSVGEVYVALTFMEALRAHRPELAFVLSTTTSTGHAIAAAQLPSDDVLIYFPVDFPPVVRRALDAIRPMALVLTEGEIWPNLIRSARDRKTPIVLINGRISDESFRGYRRLRGIFGRVASMMDSFCVQGEQDAARLVDLGAPAERIHTVGSAKYDMTGTCASARQYVGALLKEAGVADGDPVLLGGSTWPGEERLLLSCFERLKPAYPNLFLILVPRHVERTRQVVAELKRRQVRWVLRSSLKTNGGSVSSARHDVLLVDTTGELADLYAHATVVFVGKSLTDRGGQNPLEPAALGRAVIVGPNMQNFVSVMRDLRAANAIIEVADEQSLEAAVNELLADPARRAAYGESARRLVIEKRGAVETTVQHFLGHMREEGVAC